MMMMVSENKSTVPFLSPSFVYPRIAPPSSRTVVVVVVVIVYRWCSTVRRTSFKESSSFASSPLLLLFFVCGAFFIFFIRQKSERSTSLGSFWSWVFFPGKISTFSGTSCALETRFFWSSSSSRWFFLFFSHGILDVVIWWVRSQVNW